MAATYIYINSSTPETFRVGVNNAAELESLGVAAQTPPIYYLNPNDYIEQTYRLDIATDGALTTTPISYDISKPRQIILRSPNDTDYAVEVMGDGTLVTWPVSNNKMYEGRLPVDGTPLVKDVLVVNCKMPLGGGGGILPPSGAHGQLFPPAIL